nr:hypothetical protein [Streptomyces yokosukanensis]
MVTAAGAVRGVEVGAATASRRAAMVSNSASGTRKAERYDSTGSPLVS